MRESSFHNDIKTLKTRGLIAAERSTALRRWKGIARVPANGEDKRVRLRQITEGLGTYRKLDIWWVPISPQVMLFAQMGTSLAPQKSRGAALLVLTGDAEFNRDLRLRAFKQGLHLNEYGLWKWNSTSTVESEEEPPSGYWELMRAETEEEILRELGFNYIDPTRRNFEYLGLHSTNR